MTIKEGNAVLSYKQESNGRNYAGDKELVDAYSVIGIADGEGMRELIVVRCYMGRSKNSSVVYASIWVHANELYTAGHGSAGGYGYHKQSAAIGTAITNAGIKLERSIDGVGDSAIRDALKAIAAHLGYSNVLICAH